MSNTAELIVRCRHQLTRIEESTAQGIDKVAAFEIAAFAGLVTELRFAAELEYEERRIEEEQRALIARERIAEAACTQPA